MSENHDYEPELAWYRKPLWVICASALALLVLVWTGFAVVGHFTGDSENEGSKSSSAKDSKNESDDSDSVCGLKGSSETTIGTAPSVQWHNIKAVSVPKTKDAGPGKTDKSSSVPSCFAQSPEGAVLAAANYAGALGDPSVAPALIEKQGLDSASKRSVLSDMKASSDSSDDTSAYITAIDGFKMVSYDKTKAQVQIASSATINGDRHYIMTTHELQWSDGDWKMEVPDSTSSSSQSGEIPDLDGYMVFGE